MLSDSLRALRRNAGMTQSEWADLAGISTAYVPSLEGGRKPAPPPAIVATPASALHVGEDRLWATARSERDTRLIQKINEITASSRTLADFDPEDRTRARPADYLSEAHESLLTDLVPPIRTAVVRSDRPVSHISPLRPLGISDNA